MLLIACSELPLYSGLDFQFRSGFLGQERVMGQKQNEGEAQVNS